MGKSYQVSLVANTSQFKSAMADSARQMKTINSEFKNSAAETDKYGNALDKTSAKKKQLSATMEQYKMRITAIKNEQRHWTEELKKGNITEEQHAQKQQELSNRLNNTEAAMKKTEGALKRLNQEGKTAKRTYADFDKQFRDLGRSMRTVGMQVGIASGVGFLAMKRAITSVVEESMDLEHQLAEVKAISGATGSEMEGLKQQTIDLGGSTKFTAQQVAEAQAGLARAGFKVNEITGAMPGLLSLASAGNLDLAQASSITSNILRGFSIDASESGRVADVLAKGAATANTDVAGLGQAMEVVAPVAQSLGVEFESVAAATGIMADAGIDGSKSGRMLRQGMLRLSKPTGESAKLIKELGINVFDADGNMQSMDKVVGQLEKGLEGQTKQQKAAALSTIFGSESTAGWSVLLEKGSGDLAEYTTELENSEGAAKKMADTMEDSAQGKITKMESAISGLKIQLGDHLLPILGEGAEEVTNFIDKLGNMDESTQQTVAETALLVTAILGVTTVVAGLVAAAGAFMAFAGPIGVAVAAGTLGFSALGAAMYKSKLEADNINKVNTDVAHSLTDQAIEVGKNADTFDELSGKAKISNRELGHLYDINKRIAEGGSSDKIAKLQTQYNKLAEKSGLSKDELKELFGANESLIEQSPEVESSISASGNAWVDNTEAVRDYIESLYEASRVELEGEREKQLKQQVELQEEVNKKQRQHNDSVEALSLLDTLRGKSQQEIYEIEGKIVDKMAEQKQGSEEWLGLNEQLKVVQGLQSDEIDEQYLKQVEIVKEKRESLNATQEELNEVNQLSESLGDVWLKQAGITKEGEEGRVELEKTLATNNEQLAVLDQSLEKNGKLSDKEKEKYQNLTEQNEQLTYTQDYLNNELELYRTINSLVESQKQNLSEGTQERIKSLEKTHDIEVAEGNIVTQLQDKQQLYIAEKEQLEENLTKQGANKDEINEQISALDKKIATGDEVLLQMLEELGLLDLVKDGLLLNSQELEAYLETLGYSTEEAAELARILSEETIDGLNSKEEEAKLAGKTKVDMFGAGINENKESIILSTDDLIEKVKGSMGKGNEEIRIHGVSKGDALGTGLYSTHASNTSIASTLSQAISSNLGSTTDGGGGKKSGSMFSTGLYGTHRPNTTIASTLSQAITQKLGSTTDGGGGNKSGSMFQTGLSGTTRSSTSSASGISSSVSSLLGRTTDSGGGSKAGGMFSTGLSGRSGIVNTAGATVARAGVRGLKSVGTSGAGNDFVSGFRRSIAGGSVWSAAWNLGKSALSALKSSINSSSPSKETAKLGGDYVDGFTNSIHDNTRDSVSAANLLGRDSVNALSKSVEKSKAQMGATAFTLDSNKEVFTVEHKLADDFERLARSLSDANAKKYDSRHEEVSLMKRQIDLLTELVLSSRKIEKKPVLTNEEITNVVNDKNASDALGRFF